MNKASKEVFDNYKNNYERRAGNSFINLAEIREYSLERLPRWLDRIPYNAKILDAGCATGYLLGLLSEVGYCNLSGVDTSQQLIDTAKTNLRPEVSLCKEDINEFLAKTPDNTYDLILLHHVIEHIPRDATIGLLRELRRCLTEGGHLSLKTPNAACLLNGYHTCGDITHLVHFNEFSIVQALELAGFVYENIEFIEHPPILFWNYRHPIRAVFRVLNRLRWHLNKFLHWFACILLDLRPSLRVSEWELDVLIRN